VYVIIVKEPYGVKNLMYGSVDTCSSFVYHMYRETVVCYYSGIANASSLLFAAIPLGEDIVTVKIIFLLIEYNIVMNQIKVTLMLKAYEIK
jgi:hypothetical protein